MRELSRFQIECERALTEKVGQPLLDRMIKGEGQLYIFGRLPDSRLEVYIYIDGAEVLGDRIDCRFEACDYDSPEHLQRAFIKEAIKHLAHSNAAH